MTTTRRVPSVVAVIVLMILADTKSTMLLLRGCQVSAWMGSRLQHRHHQQLRRHVMLGLSSRVTTVDSAAAERRMKRLSLSLRLSSNIQQEQGQEWAGAISSTPAAAAATTTTAIVPPTIVVVKRNRQSLEFRKGSQLVFEGAISYTSGMPLQMADLVQVWVEAPDSDGGGPEDKSSSSKSSKSKKKTTRQQKSTASSETSAPAYPHYGPNDDQPPKPNQLIGWGVYNPSSLYRVRILCHANLDIALSKTITQMTKATTTTQGDGTSAITAGDVVTPIRTILRHKLLAAMETRKALALPSSNSSTSKITNTYRLVNGEGDGLSGLAIDVLNNLVVIMSSAAWCEAHRRDIVEVVEELTSRQVLWKTTPSRLKQDGWELGKKESDDESSTAQDASTAVILQESGVLYRAYPYQDGQKTGVYCDQRDNKYQLAMLCQGKSVLDLCCYHGGFSLTAKLLGGAKHCTGVDSSQDAIDVCRENAQLNGIADGDMEFIRDDVDNFMKLAAADQSKKFWDVIVLDPPKLAPSVSGLDRASRKYQSLNRDALKLINPTDGGLLLTCTCSAAMTQKDGGQFFLETVQQAALSAGRRITLLRTSGAAACHTQSPASYPAGAYLTAALFHVAAKE